jgi:hypothetical protein
VLTGRRFRLRSETLSTYMENGKRLVATIPAGDVVNVVSGPHNGDRMLDVLWNGQAVAMFVIDLEARGEEIADQGAGT